MTSPVVASPVGWLLAVVLCCGAAFGQAQPKRVGVFFWHDSPNDSVTYTGIQLGLDRAALACEFVERRADSDRERAQAGLQDLRAAGCDAVVALGTQAALLAKAALPDVPVVFAAVTNPVASGVVPGWNGSGSNLCGASNWIDPENVLDVFRLAVPDLRRLGMLRSRQGGVVSAAELASMRAFLATPTAPAVELFDAVASDEQDIPRAVQDLLEQQVDAIWIPIDITIYEHVDDVERALGQARLPLLSTAAAGVRNGAQVGAAVDYHLHGQRAAALLIDILRGDRRADEVPVDRMRSRIVIVNLSSARRRGIELPLSLLVLADELIAEANHDGPR